MYMHDRTHNEEQEDVTIHKYRKMAHIVGAR